MTSLSQEDTANRRLAVDPSLRRLPESFQSAKAATRVPAAARIAREPGPVRSSRQAIKSPPTAQASSNVRLPRYPAESRPVQSATVPSPSAARSALATVTDE